MPIAIIDLGTNTFKLLLVERPGDAGTGMRILHAEEVGVFLGRGGVEKGLLADDAMERGMDTLRVLMAKAREQGATMVRGFGTSALRNARNGSDFAARVKAELGLDIRIIPGEEEAGLILEGVRQAVPFGPKPMLVMDIGGGSTEFMLATGQALMWKHSFELGTTRLLERFPDINPMGMDTQLRIAQHIDNQFELLWSVMERHWPTTLVGSAGSFDAVAHLIALQRGEPLDSEAISLAFTREEFDHLKDRLFTLTRAQREVEPGLPAHRTDTIIPALMLVEQVLARDMQQVQWSRYSLKEGAAATVLDEAGTQG